MTDARPTRPHDDRSIRQWVPDVSLSAEGQRTLVDLLFYCFPDGTWWECSLEDGPRVHFAADSAERAAAIEHRLATALRRAAIVRDRPPRVVLDLWDGTPSSVRDASQASSGTPASIDVGAGLRVAGPAMARLMRAVDGMALEMARTLGAQEYAVPHLVSWETIERAGYARTFPQHVTTCAVVRPDLAALDRFAKATTARAREAEVRSAPVCVSPTVCLHLFAAFAGQEVTTPLVATACQSCGRYEAGVEDSPTRLWSFAMREIVYIGDRAGVRQFRSDALDLLAELAREVGLPARIASAGDPFFTDEREDLAPYQANLDLKQELCARMATDGSAVAVSSVNLHHQHFGQGFGIVLPDGAAASSACVGFGLDRWASWLLGYLDDRPDQWPDRLRRHAQ